MSRESCGAIASPARPSEGRGPSGGWYGDGDAGGIVIGAAACLCLCALTLWFWFSVLRSRDVAVAGRGFGLLYWLKTRNKIRLVFLWAVGATRGMCWARPASNGNGYLYPNCIAIASERTCVNMCCARRAHPRAQSSRALRSIEQLPGLAISIRDTRLSASRGTIIPCACTAFCTNSFILLFGFIVAVAGTAQRNGDAALPEL